MAKKLFYATKPSYKAVFVLWFARENVVAIITTRVLGSNLYAVFSWALEKDEWMTEENWRCNGIHRSSSPSHFPTIWHKEILYFLGLRNPAVGLGQRIWIVLDVFSLFSHPRSTIKNRELSSQATKTEIQSNDCVKHMPNMSHISPSEFPSFFLVAIVGQIVFVTRSHDSNHLRSALSGCEWDLYIIFFPFLTICAHSGERWLKNFSHIFRV